MKMKEVGFPEDPVSKEPSQTELEDIRGEVDQQLPVDAPMPLRYCPAHGPFLGKYCPDPPPHNRD